MGHTHRMYMTWVTFSVFSVLANTQRLWAGIEAACSLWMSFHVGFLMTGTGCCMGANLLLPTDLCLGLHSAGAGCSIAVSDACVIVPLALMGLSTTFDLYATTGLI